MTGALWYAAADLMARQEERKVILILTDGQTRRPRQRKEMIRKAVAGRHRDDRRRDRDRRVDRLFPVAIQVIGYVTDLKGQLFGIAEQLLLR